MKKKIKFMLLYLFILGVGYYVGKNNEKIKNYINRKLDEIIISLLKKIL
jgi:hypothetical protein